MKHSFPKDLQDTVKQIPFNELPEYSEWPYKLIGLSDFPQVTRDSNFIQREYNEKWGRLLKEVQNAKLHDLRSTLAALSKIHSPQTMIFHMDESFYQAETSSVFWDFIYSNIIRVLEKYLTPTATIAELGCGWGRNLFYFYHSRICKTIIGGEYTDVGVELATYLAEKFDIDASFHHFDYNDPSPEFCERLTDAVVFSHNSIEQIPYLSKEAFIKLSQSHPKVVIHFEPIFEYRTKSSMIHLMWRRYTQLNDYNRNLLSLLKELEKEGYLRILEEKVHALGLNAFNPGSYLIWEPIR